MGNLSLWKVSNVGTGCASSDTVSITVGNCAVAPQVTGECRQGTDDSATYGQANSYTFDGNTLKDASGNSLSESASEQGSPINSGVLFELTTAAKNAGNAVMMSRKFAIISSVNSSLHSMNGRPGPDGPREQVLSQQILRPSSFNSHYL